MVNPNNYSDFDLLMDILSRYYQYADYKTLFTPHTIENVRLRLLFESQKTMYERWIAQREKYDPKEDPFEVHITSEVKVK